MKEKTETIIENIPVMGSVRQMETSYSTHFATNFNVDGSPTSITLERIFNAPQENIKDIVAYSKYCYRKYGIIMRVVNIIRDFGSSGIKLSYPTKDKAVEPIIDAYNDRVDMKQLTSDMIFELALTGNLACYDRDGARVDIYPIDQIKVLPLIKNNKQLIAYNTEMTTLTLDSFGKEIDELVKTAYPKEILEAKKNNTTYKPLDPEKSYFAKINASQYESYGISVILPAFEDLSHKSLLKEAEKSTANDIINNVMLIKVGDAQNQVSGDVVRQYGDIFAGIKGACRVAVPYYVDISFLQQDTEVFGKDKFIEIDTDILNTLGVSLTLIRGEGGGNYAEGMLNFTGLVRTIEGIRNQIPKIVEGLYRAELTRNGINPDKAPTLKFDDVVIDKESRFQLVKDLFTTAGLPYQILYEEFDMDFDYVKMIREDENNKKMDSIFKVRSLPFQGQANINEPAVETPEDNGVPDKGGAPTKTQSARKTDKTASNNNAPRSGLKQKL